MGSKTHLLPPKTINSCLLASSPSSLGALTLEEREQLCLFHPKHAFRRVAFVRVHTEELMSPMATLYVALKSSDARVGQNLSQYSDGVGHAVVEIVMTLT